MKPDADECGRWMISIKEILIKRRKTTIVSTDASKENMKTTSGSFLHIRVVFIK